MTEQERFEKEVNETLNENSNDKNTSNAIKVCDTPQILLDYGLEQRPMLYNKGHCKDAIKEKDRIKHTHGLTLQQIYDMPKNIASPAMILKSSYDRDKNMPILIFNDCDEDKLPLFMIIKTNEEGLYEFERIETNKILSLYGRENFEKYFENVLENNGLVYYNKEKVQILDQLCGTRFSDRCSSFEPNIILQKYDSNVKNKFSEATNKIMNSDIKDTLEEDCAEIIKRITKNNRVKIDNGNDNENSDEYEKSDI